MWVYEIGTYPFFSAVAPGQVTSLSPETPQGGPQPERERVEEEGERERVEEVEEEEEHVPEGPQVAVFDRGQQVPVYPPYRPEPEDTRKVLYQIPDPEEVPVEEREPEEPYAEPPRVHPVQYQPENPQVVVVDEGVINLDGEPPPAQLPPIMSFPQPLFCVQISLLAYY